VGDHSWVHLSSGENILAHIHDVEVPVANDVGDDARETARNVSSSLADFGNEGEPNLDSVAMPGAPSLVPSLAQSALSEIQ